MRARSAPGTRPAQNVSAASPAARRARSDDGSTGAHAREYGIPAPGFSTRIGQSAVRRAFLNAPPTHRTSRVGRRLRLGAKRATVDRDLVEAAQRGDREAYVDLVRPRADRLFAIAQRILRDVDRAEDAFQDALVIAWRDLRGLRDPDRFDAWLQKLLINVCIRQASRERRRVANLRVLPVDGPAAPDELPHHRRPGPARARVPAAVGRPAGRPHPASLRGLRPQRDRRDPRHPAGHGPLPTA